MIELSERYYIGKRFLDTKSPGIWSVLSVETVPGTRHQQCVRLKDDRGNVRVVHAPKFEKEFREKK